MSADRLAQDMPQYEESLRGKPTQAELEAQAQQEAQAQADFEAEQKAKEEAQAKADFEAKQKAKEDYAKQYASTPAPPEFIVFKGGSRITNPDFIAWAESSPARLAQKEVENAVAKQQIQSATTEQQYKEALWNYKHTSYVKQELGINIKTPNYDKQYASGSRNGSYYGKGSTLNRASAKDKYIFIHGTDAGWNAIIQAEDNNRKTALLQSAGLRAQGNAEIKAAQNQELKRLGGVETSPGVFVNPTLVSNNITQSRVPSVGIDPTTGKPSIAAKAQDFPASFQYNAPVSTGSPQLDAFNAIATPGTSFGETNKEKVNSPSPVVSPYLTGYEQTPSEAQRTHEWDKFNLRADKIKTSQQQEAQAKDAFSQLKKPQEITRSTPWVVGDKGFFTKEAAEKFSLGPQVSAPSSMLGGFVITDETGKIKTKTLPSGKEVKLTFKTEESAQKYIDRTNKPKEVQGPVKPNYHYTIELTEGGEPKDVAFVGSLGNVQAIDPNTEWKYESERTGKTHTFLTEKDANEFIKKEEESPRLTQFQQGLFGVSKFLDETSQNIQKDKSPLGVIISAPWGVLNPIGAGQAIVQGVVAVENILVHDLPKIALVDTPWLKNKRSQLDPIPMKPSGDLVIQPQTFDDKGIRLKTPEEYGKGITDFGDKYGYGTLTGGAATLVVPVAQMAYQGGKITVRVAQSILQKTIAPALAKEAKSIALTQSGGRIGTTSRSASTSRISSPSKTWDVIEKSGPVGTRIPAPAKQIPISGRIAPATEPNPFYKQSVIPYAITQFAIKASDFVKTIPKKVDDVIPRPKEPEVIKKAREGVVITSNRIIAKSKGFAVEVGAGARQSIANFNKWNDQDIAPKGTTIRETRYERMRDMMWPEQPPVKPREPSGFERKAKTSIDMFVFNTKQNIKRLDEGGKQLGDKITIPIKKGTTKFGKYIVKQTIPPIKKAGKKISDAIPKVTLPKVTTPLAIQKASRSIRTSYQGNKFELKKSIGIARELMWQSEPTTKYPIVKYNSPMTLKKQYTDKAPIGKSDNTSPVKPFQYLILRNEFPQFAMGPKEPSQNPPIRKLKSIIPKYTRESPIGKLPERDVYEQITTEEIFNKLKSVAKTKRANINKEEIKQALIPNQTPIAYNIKTKEPSLFYKPKEYGISDIFRDKNVYEKITIDEIFGKLKRVKEAKRPPVPVNYRSIKQEPTFDINNYLGPSKRGMTPVKAPSGTTPIYPVSKNPKPDLVKEYPGLFGKEPKGIGKSIFKVDLKPRLDQMNLHEKITTEEIFRKLKSVKQTKLQNMNKEEQFLKDKVIPNQTPIAYNIKTREPSMFVKPKEYEVKDVFRDKNVYEKTTTKDIFEKLESIRQTKLKNLTKELPKSNIKNSPIMKLDDIKPRLKEMNIHEQTTSEDIFNKLKNTAQTKYTNINKELTPIAYSIKTRQPVMYKRIENQEISIFKIPEANLDKTSTGRLGVFPIKETETDKIFRELGRKKRPYQKKPVQSRYEPTDITPSTQTRTTRDIGGDESKSRGGQILINEPPETKMNLSSPSNEYPTIGTGSTSGTKTKSPTGRLIIPPLLRKEEKKKPVQAREVVTPRSTSQFYTETYLHKDRPKMDNRTTLGSRSMVGLKTGQITNVRFGTQIKVKQNIKSETKLAQTPKLSTSQIPKLATSQTPKLSTKQTPKQRTPEITKQPTRLTPKLGVKPLQKARTVQRNRWPERPPKPIGGLLPPPFKGDYENKKTKKRKNEDFLGSSPTDRIEGMFRRTEIITGDKKTERQLAKDKRTKFISKSGSIFKRGKFKI